MPLLLDYPVACHGGYYPSAPALPPAELQHTIRAGRNVWLRLLGKLQVARGPAQIAATNVGPRLFSMQTDRVAFGGALVSDRIPYAGFLRYEHAVVFYLSENVSQSIYVNEVAASGLQTSSVAGKLRIGIPDGSGGYTSYDAGVDPPVLASGDVTVGAGGTKAMSGDTGVSLSHWRSITDAVSAPSATIYKAAAPTTADLFHVALPALPAGWDGFVLAGTRWGDRSGDVRIIRFVYKTPRGTFSATNGNANLAGDANTRWLKDLRPGDVTDAGTIATVTSDSAATLTAGYGGTTGAGKTMTLTNVAADWYNGELGSLINRDAEKPGVAAGVLAYAGRVYLWGTDGASGNPTGPGIRPLLLNNPEFIDTTVILTEEKDDLLNVLTGNNAMYLMTNNTLESVTFTGREDLPYVVRVLHRPGFRSPLAGCVYKDRFYGYSENPLRTVQDQNIDLQFGAPVFSDMEGWDSSRVITMIDPKNEAVIYAHWAVEPSGTVTTCLPFMPQLPGDPWGPPHRIAGRIIDWTNADGELAFVVYTGGNFRVYRWEGGAGASGAFVATQFLNAQNTAMRLTVKSFTWTGKANQLKAFLLEPDDTIPDLTDGAADETYTLSGSEKSEEQIGTHLTNFRAVAVRVDFPSDGMWDNLMMSGYGLEERR